MLPAKKSFGDFPFVILSYDIYKSEQKLHTGQSYPIEFQLENSHHFLGRH